MGCRESKLGFDTNATTTHPQIVGGCALCGRESVRVADAPVEDARNTGDQTSQHQHGCDLQESLKTIKGFEKFLGDMGKWLGRASEKLSSMSADQLNEQWEDSYGDLVDELREYYPVSNSFSQAMTNVQKSTQNLENTCHAELMNIETNLSKTRSRAQIIQAGLVVAGIPLAPISNVSVIGKVVDIWKEIRTTSLENKLKNSKEMEEKIQHVRNKIDERELQMRLKWLHTYFMWLLKEVDKLAERTRAGRHTDKHETNELGRIIDSLKFEVKKLQLDIKRLRDCILDLVRYMKINGY